VVRTHQQKAWQRKKASGTSGDANSRDARTDGNIIYRRDVNHSREVSKSRSKYNSRDARIVGNTGSRKDINRRREEATAETSAKAGTPGT
jgi:hypothetical protein